jgi:hypothetical protein
MAYGMSGQRDKALALHEELVQRQQAGEYISPVAFLAIDAGLRDVEAVRADILAYLEDGGNGWAIEVALGSYLDEFATHPACAELLRRIARTGET